MRSAGIGAAVGTAGADFFQNFFVSPPCPKFPSASLVAAFVAMTAYNLLRWLGLWLGPLAGLCFSLQRRADRVEWARKTPAERMSFVSVAALGIAGIAAFMLGRISGDSTLKLVYKQRPSRRIAS